MTKTDQQRFVADLCNSVVVECQAKIAQGRVPPEWDGHELRQWLADRFADASWTLKQKRARYREYKNTVLVNNL